jgi:hypothetical protein
MIGWLRTRADERLALVRSHPIIFWSDLLSCEAIQSFFSPICSRPKPSNHSSETLKCVVRFRQLGAWVSMDAPLKTMGLRGCCTPSIGKDNHNSACNVTPLAPCSEALLGTAVDAELDDLQEIISALGKQPATSNGKLLACGKESATTIQLGRPSNSFKAFPHQETADRRAATWALRQLRVFMEKISGTYRSGGNVPAGVHQIKNVLSAAFLHSGPPPDGLLSAFMRVTGFSRSMVQNGSAIAQSDAMTKVHLKKESQILKMQRAPHSHGKRKRQDWTWVWEWFHKHCPLVDFDKSRNIQLKGRNLKIVINGESRNVTCPRMFAEATKTELVESFFASPEYAEWQASNPQSTLGQSSVQRLICPCIQSAKISECSCKICTEFINALKSWEEQRREWHKEATCSCEGCSDPNMRARYMSASKDIATFRSVVLCAKKQYPGLVLPHLPSMIPEFYRLECCMKNPKKPEHMSACQKCGVNRRLYSYDNCIERTQQKATWMQWIDTEVDASGANGGKAMREVFRKVTGTRRQLLERVFELAPKFMNHIWVHQLTSHQAKLRYATFDGSKVLQLKADFAATVELKSSNMGTCEFGRQTNLYVCLALHSPSEAPPIVGKERAVTCDVWRYFSNAKPSTMVHQRVLQDIARYYKKKNSSLEWIEIETDGCASQFKGRKNFFAVAGWCVAVQLGVLYTHMCTYTHTRT